jgi:hypothetical protein
MTMKILGAEEHSLKGIHNLTIEKEQRDMVLFTPIYNICTTAGPVDS